MLEPTDDNTYIFATLDLSWGDPLGVRMMILFTKIFEVGLFFHINLYFTLPHILETVLHMCESQVFRLHVH